ncbi:MAG: DNA polymerase III subunit gamma/tau [Pseudomonadota bacterium]
MSYQVLARKYRPANFQEMEGQEHVLRALVNALEQNRLHHAYLFTGTRGVGKTTIARILARCLNCETGVTATPCGQCSSCQEIAQGRSVDLIEVDAASRTRVEDTRELLDNVQYMPTRSRFKVYLIDEVHMLSNHSFNALLKTLEEPPEHVKFLLATTDPKKLPVTVLSRCLQFNLKNLSPERVVHYLKQILAREQIEYDEAALWQLGRAADGSMRDALSLTDQAISFGENRLGEADVRLMLGSIDHREVYELLDALIAKDAARLLARIAELAEFGPDYEMLLAEMLRVLHRVAVAQAVPGGVDNSQGDKELVEAVAGSLGRDDVQLYYQIGLIGQRDLPLAPDPRDGFEMIMLRMLAFAPAEMMASPGGGQTDPGGSGGGSGPNPPVPGGDSPVKDILSRISSGRKTDTPVASQPTVTPAPEERSAGHKALLETRQAGPTIRSADTDPIPVESRPRDLPDDNHEPEECESDEPVQVSPEHWTQVFHHLGLTGVTRTLAANCILVEVTPESIALRLEQHHASLWNETHEKRIAAALTRYLGRKTGVRIETGPVDRETPAQASDREAEEKRVQAVSAIQNDSNVQQLIQTFDGKLNVESIVPRTQAGE